MLRRPKSLVWSPAVVGLIALLGACGPTHFSIHSVSASRHVEQARHMGAETLAPYEFRMAVSHLDKAREEAGKAEYHDAVKLARIANEQAQKAVVVARERKGSQR